MSDKLFRIPKQDQPQFNSLSDKVVGFLKSNHILAMPSDTIYGILGRFVSSVINRLHEIKKRDVDKPFLLLVPEGYLLEHLVDERSFEALAWAKQSDVWPGRNTLIFFKNKKLAYPVTDKIAIRIPSKSDNEFLYSVLKKLGEPVVAPSLNIHGKEPLEKEEDILREFENLLDEIFIQEDFTPSGASRITDTTTFPYRKVR